MKEKSSVSYIGRMEREREREREKERANMKRANYYFVAAPWLPSI